jgi:hypothetical protein
VKLLQATQVRFVREDNGWYYGETSTGGEVNISCMPLRHRMQLFIGDILVGSFWGDDEDQLEGRLSPDPARDVYFLASDRVESSSKVNQA